MPLRSIQVLTLVGSLLLLTVTTARAAELAVEGESVTLAALVPALEGTELGAVVVAEAPLPGESRVVRASDIKAVLKAEGRDARGLDLPRSTRLVRRARTVSDTELAKRVREAVEAQVAPCTVAALSNLPAVTLGAGDYDVNVVANARRDSGRVSMVVLLAQGGRSQRISAQLELSCPAAVVQPGASVRLLVVSGMVRVSAPGTVHQAGRVGDEVRVTNSVTKRQLRARVLDAQTVEVMP